MAALYTPTQEISNLDILDDDHRNTLDRAVRNVLSTEPAERAYAQILDGLPTEQSLRDSQDYVKDHPVHSIEHSEICPGYIEKAREFRNGFDLFQLRLGSKTLEHFQNSVLGSEEFHLRLIELVVTACHQIGAYLFELDEGAHKHKFYQDWREKVLYEKECGVQSRRFYDPLPIAFCHRAYRYYEQYPRGVADVAGYWAESKIFGGVFVFDRGEGEEDCKALWIHGDLVRGPETLYPPTKEQFDVLIAFLTTPVQEDKICPFPIHGTRINRPRWHPYHAFAYHHIFRDRYERKLPPHPPQVGCVGEGIDWPELNDRRILLLGGFSDSGVGEDEYAAAEERIRNITPSSPLWRSFGNGS
ncbi:hypothetical protein BKA59DRAFT_476168 [Fusarium tricinctum]|uniref:Uncharacterized protein n=1 Tax=Fusarium tricinctum TaxID=61284 RepID=A0A8K0RY81_9HYPO|nr:hypothetical protein BKA59DRAFT_476168 [Fusarium tricinctum]